MDIRSDYRIKKKHAGQANLSLKNPGDTGNPPTLLLPFDFFGKNF